MLHGERGALHVLREWRDVQEIQTTKGTDSQVEGSTSPTKELGNPKHDERTRRRTASLETLNLEKKWGNAGQTWGYDDEQPVI